MNLKIPREPASGAFEFRARPTPIWARKGRFGWGLFEWHESDLKVGERWKSRCWELDARADWKIIYPLGARLVRVLAGRSITEAKLENIPAADFAAAVAELRENVPWLSAVQVEQDPRTGRFLRKAEPYHKQPARLPAGPERLLTLREKQVLALLCAGHQNKEIGRQLAITTRTAESHRNNLYRKAGVNNGMTLVRWAIRQGFIEP